MQMTSYLQDKQLTIALSGEIDHHGAKATLRAIAEKIHQYLPALCVLDLRGVSFMDSSGIAVVIHTLRRMNELEGVLKLRQVPPQPMKVLQAAGIDRIVETERRLAANEM